MWRTADATSVTAAETMTWNAGRPARSGTAAVGDFGAVPGRTRVAAPVTGLSGNGVVSFELAPQSGDGLDFLARETTTAGNRPHLVLTVTTG